MKTIELKTSILECQPDELSADEQLLVKKAVEATESSYAPYSHFHVGAAVRLDNGMVMTGCNQENAAFPVTICAERTALFAAAAQHPEAAVTALAIAARNAKGELQEEPVSPCGSCRQALIETERRYGRPVRLLLVGARCVYVIDGIKQLMPLSFSDF